MTAIRAESVFIAMNGAETIEIAALRLMREKAMAGRGRTGSLCPTRLAEAASAAAWDTLLGRTIPDWVDFKRAGCLVIDVHGIQIRSDWLDGDDVRTSSLILVVPVPDSIGCKPRSRRSIVVGSCAGNRGATARLSSNGSHNRDRNVDDRVVAGGDHGGNSARTKVRINIEGVDLVSNLGSVPVMCNAGPSLTDRMLSKASSLSTRGGGGLDKGSLR